MPGLIINGQEVQAPGFTIYNWHDDRRWRLKMGEDGRARHTRWVRSIFGHTTMGLPVKLLPGRGPGHGGDTALSWSLSPSSGGAHLIVDQDTTILCIADLLLEAAYHATSVNDVSIGIELRQGHGDHSLYVDQVETAADLVVAVHDHFHIWKQLHAPYLHGPVPRLHVGGTDCVGFFGHRDQTGNKGIGDPGDEIYAALQRRGFEAFDFSQDEDLVAWRERQRRLNALGWTPALAVDGVPGPKTWKAWQALGPQTHNGYVEG